MPRKAIPTALLSLSGMVLLAGVLAACSTDRDGASVASPVVAALDAADAEITVLLTGLLQSAREAPQDAESRGRLGMAYEVNGFADAALESYRQAGELDSNDPRWPYYQAMLLAHRGDLEPALGHLAASIHIDPGYAPAWLWRGTWLLDLDQLERAAAAFAEAGVLGAELPSTVGRARVLLKQRQAAQAISLLQPLSDKERLPYIYKLLGQAFAQLGQADQARQALAQVDGSGLLVWADARSEQKKSYEGSLSARLAKARDLMQRGQPTEALREIEGLRKHYPDHQGLLSTLSEAYRQTDQQERSLAVLQHGLQVHPDYYAFHLNIADHYIRSGNGDRAFAHLQRVIDLNPAVSWAHAQMGLLLLERDRLEDALAAFRTSLHHDPNDATVYYYAGMAEASRAGWTEAIRLFGGSVEVDPEFTLGHVALGRSLTESGRYDEARAALAAALRIGTYPGEVQAARAALAKREAGTK